jgi:hypothetical protein
MKKITTLICLCICILFQRTLFAQDSTARKAFIKDSVEKSMDSLFRDFSPPALKSYFVAGVSFLSNNVYLGRKDSVATPYITPSLSYYHKSGLFVSASASYLLDPGEDRIDLVTIEGGYSLITKNFDGQITVAKFFFNKQSFNVRSEIEGSAEMFLGYNLGFIKPTLALTTSFGDKTDYAAAVGLEHTFYSTDRDLTITPTIVANASTQNYYNDYYKLRRYALSRLNRILGYSISAFVENASQFKMLDYEASLPINYSINKLTFNFTPSFAIPVNPAVVSATLTTNSGIVRTKTAREKLKNSFFYTAGISLSF